MMALTPKQELFCQEFIINGNQAESYIKAGYVVKNQKTAGRCASRLMKNQKIQNYLKELRDKVESEKIADASEVLEYWTSVMRGESVADVVCNGEIVKKPPNEFERLEASKQLAKRLGLDKPDDSTARAMLDRLDKVIGDIDAIADE